MESVSIPPPEALDRLQRIVARLEARVEPLVWEELAVLEAARQTLARYVDA